MRLKKCNCKNICQDMKKPCIKRSLCNDLPSEKAKSRSNAVKAFKNTQPTPVFCRKSNCLKRKIFPQKEIQFPCSTPVGTAGKSKSYRVLPGLSFPSCHADERSCLSGRIRKPIPNAALLLQYAAAVKVVKTQMLCNDILQPVN